MMLKLFKVVGYKTGSIPIAGECVAAFTGNKNQCTSQAKTWIKDNPKVDKPMWKWE